MDYTPQQVAIRKIPFILKSNELWLWHVKVSNGSIMEIEKVKGVELLWAINNFEQVEKLMIDGSAWIQERRDNGKVLDYDDKKA